MDIISNRSNLVSVPALSTAFSVLRFIMSTVQQIQASRQQLMALVTSTAQLMETLNVDYVSGRLSPDTSAEALDNLKKLLNQVSDFVQQQAEFSFLKSMYTKNGRISQIDVYHRQIGNLVTSFQAGCIVSVCVH
jgi:mevalonate kinase